MEACKTLLQQLISDIPGHMSGIDRQSLIGDRLQRMSPDDRTTLRTVLETAFIQMAERDASDIDLGGPGCDGAFWYRIHGVKQPDNSNGSFSMLETDALCQNLLTDSQLTYLYREKNLDFSWQVDCDDQRYRFRADLYFDLDHLALNCRYIVDEIRPFKNLGLHPNAIRQLMLKTDKQGLILVTGITGSGKSSTLDSIIDANNHTVDAHVVIIASPVETIHRPDRCIIRHREVGQDVRSFKEGAVQALRQDPDIIVIGEMRDPQTIMTALEITDSGHKVFSTLHTASAVESIDRIIAECPPEEQERVRNRLADTLQCVIAQKLIPTLDGGRTLAMEVMLITSSIRAAIKNNNTGEIYQMIHEGSAKGMQSMEQSLRDLVRSNTISADEAGNYANNKQRMSELLGMAV